MALSKRPYLLRAINEWLLDSGMTPHVLVDATDKNVIVPRNYVEDGRIVLNIAPAAVRNLEIGNDLLTCSARFHGNIFNISVPVDNILAIFGKEDGMGIVFQDEAAEEEPPPAVNKEAVRLERAPHLKLVK